MSQFSFLLLKTTAVRFNIQIPPKKVAFHQALAAGQLPGTI
jgi:hypothetical protein